MKVRGAGELDWIGGFVVPGRHDDSMLLRVYESYPRYWMHKQLIHMYRTMDSIWMFIWIMIIDNFYAILAPDDSMCDARGSIAVFCCNSKLKLKYP